MEKSPFILVAICGMFAIMVAIVARELGNIAGGQMCLVIGTSFLLFYAIVRIIFDFLPARLLRDGKRNGYPT